MHGGDLLTLDNMYWVDILFISDIYGDDLSTTDDMHGGANLFTNNIDGIDFLTIGNMHGWPFEYYLYTWKWFLNYYIIYIELGSWLPKIGIELAF